MWLRWWRKLKESFKKKSIFEESKYMYKHKHNILSSVLHISQFLSVHTNMYVIYLDKYAMYVAFYRDTSALFGSWVPLSSFLSLLLLLLESNYFLPSSCQCWMFFLWRRRGGGWYFLLVPLLRFLLKYSFVFCSPILLAAKSNQTTTQSETDFTLVSYVMLC